MSQFYFTLGAYKFFQRQFKFFSVMIDENLSAEILCHHFIVTIH